jgi:hypothetical protein
MRSLHHLVLCIGLGALPGGDSRTVPAAALLPPPDLVSAWAALWGETATFDETWLLRVAPGTGDATLVENCAQQLGRLRLVADLPVSAAPGGNFLGDFTDSGFAAHVVGAVIETPRGRAGIVALDLRDEWTSLLIPCTTLPEAELGDAAQAVRHALQLDGERELPAALARWAPAPESLAGAFGVVAMPLDEAPR